MPEVQLSVIIATYNRARSLQRAIASVLACGLGSVEVIVVDDGSTDETPIVMRQYGSPVSFLRLEHRGFPNRNPGLAVSTGQYVSFLDDDDIWLSGEVVRMVEVLDAHPELVLLFGDVCTLQSMQPWRSVFRYGNDLPWQPLAAGVRLYDRHAFFLRLLHRNMLYLGAALVRREALLEAHGFDDAVFPSEDWELILRLAHKYPFAFMPDSVVAAHADGGYFSPNEDRMNGGFIRVLAQLNRKLDLSAEEHAFIANELKGLSHDWAYLAYDRGDLPAARQRFAQAMRYSGVRPLPLAYWLLCHLPANVVRQIRNCKQALGEVRRRS